MCLTNLVYLIAHTSTILKEEFARVIKNKNKFKGCPEGCLECSSFTNCTIFKNKINSFEPL